MGNTISNQNNNYGIEISAHTRSVLKQDSSGRWRAISKIYPNIPRDQQKDIYQDLTSDGFVIAMLENIMTPEQVNTLRRRGVLYQAFSKNALIGIKEKLFTINDFISLKSGFFARYLVSDNGLYALRNGLLTLEQIQSLPNDLYFKELVSDAGIQALQNGKINIENIREFASDEDLRTYLEGLYDKPKVDVIVETDPLMLNRAINDDPERKIKFNRMLRYLESNYARGKEKAKHEFNLLKEFDEDLKNNITRFYKIHDKIEYYSPCLDMQDHFFLLDLILQARSELQTEFQKKFKLGKVGVIQSDLVKTLDNTVAQCIQSGIFTREHIETKGTYTPKELDNLLSRTYVEPQAHQHNLPPLSSLEMENPQTARAQVIERLLEDAYPTFEDQQSDLLKLFALRRYYQPDGLSHQRINQVETEIRNFWLSMDKRENWEKPEVLALTRKLLIKSLLVTDEILASLEYFFTSNHYLNDPNDKLSSYLVSLLLANQQRRYCRPFAYQGIIDFYPLIREKSIFIPDDIAKNDNGIPHYKHNRCTAESFDSAFLKQDSMQHYFRKIYNTFIKYGFNEYYGDSHDKGEGFRDMLGYCEYRFLPWTALDQVKPAKLAFNPLRLFSNQEAQKELTYAFPMSSTRPT